MQKLSQLQVDPVFVSLPTPTLLLDPDLTIRAVSRSYAKAVRRHADELIGMAMLEAFPDNPEMAAADGVANLGRSFELAAQLRRAHHMLVQRYDIVDLERGCWLTRVWSPVNTPVLAEKSMLGLLHQVHDITPIGAEIASALRGYRDLLLQASPSDVAAWELAQHADSVATCVTTNEALAVEVAHLRRALTSRATIDQAKGIVMAERRCTPEEAFHVLRTLSQDANVRLADVALALVYKCRSSGARSPSPTPERARGLPDG